MAGSSSSAAPISSSRRWRRTSFSRKAGARRPRPEGVRYGERGRGVRGSLRRALAGPASTAADTVRAGDDSPTSSSPVAASAGSERLELSRWTSSSPQINEPFRHSRASSQAEIVPNAAPGTASTVGRALPQARGTRSHGRLRPRGVRRRRRGLPVVRPRARGAVAGRRRVGVTVAVHTSATTPDSDIRQRGAEIAVRSTARPW